MTDHFIEGAETQLRHDFANFLGDEAHEIDDVVGVAGKLLAQAWVLGGHSYRTGIEMAYSHHDTAERYQRRRGKAKLLSAQQSTNHHIAAGFELAIHLNDNAAAQIVEHQRLLRLGQSQFPRGPC